MIRIREVSSPREAHEAVTELYQQVMKPYTRRGARGRIIFESVCHWRRHELRKLFHGPMLADFAEQVWLPEPGTGRRIRYAPIVWKEHLKDLFCPMKENPRTKKLERSTELLNDDEFSEFLEKVRAYGTLDLGVEFTEKEGG